MTDETAMLSQYVRWFEEAEETSWDARKLAERDRDYVDGKQLTDREISVLKQRGQPPVTFNVIKDKVGFLQGVEKSQRTDPKAFARTPQHDQDAEAATDALRYVCENNDYQSSRSRVFRNLVVEGIGGIRVGVKMGQKGPEISLKRVSWDRFFFDPHSSEADFSDAAYFGEVVWMDYEDAVATYPEHADDLNVTYNSNSMSDTYDDKPRWKVWADKARKRIRVVQMYHQKQGVWHFCEFVRGAVLKAGPAPFLDENGMPEPDMIMESTYVDRENNRYGEVRQFIDPQDEINKRRSKALHLLTMRQVIADRGAVDDPEAAKRQLARPDGFIEKNPGMEFEIASNMDLTSGQVSLYQETMNYMDRIGPNAAMLGDAEGQSGRAIQAQQQGGMMEMGDLLDTLRRFDVRVYRAIWNRVRQFWTDERWVRVTDNEENVKFVGFNRPMTVEQQLMELPDEQRAQEMQRMRLMPGDPRLRMISKIQNPVAEMDVDIIIEDAPDTVTIQGEQFEQLMQIFPALAQMPPQFAKVAIKASQLRNKDELIELFEGGGEMTPEQQQIAQMQQQMQQIMAQLGIEKAKQEVAKTASEVRLNDAKAVNEIQNAQMPPTAATYGR
ncbi:MAG: hypothetical protein AAFY24_01895 [Pseudomonadota bacterium]